MIALYNDRYAEAWDDFVLNRSINGNFLQTRRFLDYHPKGRFKDASLVFFKNDNIAALIPANEINNGGVLIAHQGSTYGGLIIGKEYANSTNYKWIFDEMTEYFKKKAYDTVELRMHNWLYSPVKKHNELLDYYFQLYDFRVRSEVGFYIELNNLDKDYINHFEKMKKRKLNKAIRYNLEFLKLETDYQVSEYYDILVDNMRKFNTVPVHSLEQILDFKNTRLKEVTSFYGVYYKEKMIAGSMVWNFCDKKVFHTQYLASRRDCLEYCPNEYLYSKLIQTAKDEDFCFLSFGTASLNKGLVYNESLGMYKEGFNTDSYINKCFIWEHK